LEYHPKYVEDMAREIASKKCVGMDDAKIIEGLKEGMALACTEMATVGIVPRSVDQVNGIPDKDFNSPWLTEKEDLKVMRRAEATGDGEWVDAAGGVDVLANAMGQ
jgi:hypothetical protein